MTGEKRKFVKNAGDFKNGLDVNCPLRLLWKEYVYDCVFHNLASYRSGVPLRRSNIAGTRMTLS
jgi:hypothetical protein